MKKKIQLITAATVAAGLAFATPGIANAVTPGNSTVAPDVVLSKVAPESLGTLAPVQLSADAAEHVVGNVTTSVPLAADQDITLGDASLSVGIGLPYAASAKPVDTQADSVVAFDNGNKSKTATVLNADGSVQINTIIDGPSAPSRYDYDLDLPSGAVVEKQGDGSILITDTEGKLIAGVEPAWAKDANGAPVNTWYEVEAARITQVVEHSSANQYPIVADPKVSLLWWGSAVKFSKAETKTIRDNFSPSYWANAVCKYAGIGWAACLAAINLRLWTWQKPVNDAANQGRCAQLNIPHATGPGFWNVTNEKC